ncbi:MAG: DUF2950 family protein [Planctomycetes bacterium]|nr:DUF2950 family protein [Planctomycetota bacterium]
MKRMFGIALVLASILLVLPGQAEEGGAAPAAKMEASLPANVVAALLIPDLAQARAEAGKTNLAEMFAQPEMQAFCQPVLAAMKDLYGKLQAGNPLMPTLADVDAGLFAGEIALAAYARPAGSRQPLGLLFLLRPKDEAAFKRMLPPPFLKALESGQAVPMVPIPNQDVPAVAYAGGRLAFCLSKNDLDAQLAALKAPAAEGSLAGDSVFQKVRGRLPNSSAWFFVRPRQAAALLLPQGGPKVGRETAAAIRLLTVVGLNNVEALGVGLGFTREAPVMEGYLAYSGTPKGLLALFHGAKPPTAEAFKIAEKDAPYVATGRFDFAAVLPLVREAANAVDVEAWGKLEAFLGKVNETVGFDVQNDFLANLGPDFVVAQTSVDTGAPLSFSAGMVYALPLKDPAKIGQCLAKLDEALAKVPQTYGSYGIKKLDHRGTAIHYLRGIVLPGPAALAVHGQHLLVGTSVNALRHALDQLGRNETILDNPDFQAAVARAGGKAFDKNALPPCFAYAVDRGSGTGTLVLAVAGIAAGTTGLGAVAQAGGFGGAAAGKSGMSARMAANESAAIAACMVYAEAQDIYRRTDWDGDGVLEYAQAFNGDNSLFEKNKDKGDLTLIDAAMAKAEGVPGTAEPKNGYVFKVLKGQGDNVPGGKKSYVVAGAGNSANSMTLGYALVACPAVYDKTGLNTYIINNTGTVYKKDLGENTLEIYKAMTEYSPGEGWAIANEEFEPTPAPSLATFFDSPGGKAAMEVLQAVDLGLWPDAGFFARFRRPAAAASFFDADGLYWRTDLPPPGSSNPGSMDMMTTTALVAVIAAIAIPNLLRSRMVANESAAIAACKTFAEAEDIYRRTDWDGDGVLEYAQSIKGDNSLYEKNAGKGDLTLVDSAFANAEGDPGQTPPKAGYVFKVLKGQGPKAPGGRKSYVVAGHGASANSMTLGYALVACPADYDGSGRNTFIINNTGTVYQKDLGPETPDIVKAMTEYDPDETWVVAE